VTSRSFSAPSWINSFCQYHSPSWLLCYVHIHSGHAENSL